MSTAEKPAPRRPATEPATRSAPRRPLSKGVPPRLTVAHQPAHASLICVAAPALAISTEHGQLRGEGLEGFYDAGRRVLSRCQLRLADQEPVPLQGRMVSARQARFLAAARTPADSGPDPQVTVERVRSADGTERISVRNASGRTLRLPVELRLGTDLAELGAVAIGQPGDEVSAIVYGTGLRWTRHGVHSTVTAHPAPDTSLASTGLLQWDWELSPGESRSILLGVELAEPAQDARARPRSGGLGAGAGSAVVRTGVPSADWAEARADGDEPRVRALFRTSLDDLGALLLRDPVTPSDLHLAAGVPWRCSLAPAESLRAARMLLPLGTSLAAGTLRTLARAQLTGGGQDTGRLPGVLRHAGPWAAPSCTGIEATLLFPTVLAEARRWGLPERETERLLPTAERCLWWMRRAAGESGSGYVPDPAPDGPYRCEVQAQAHRAALLGAELLDAYGKDGGEELRGWAAELRRRFGEDFWWEDHGGGRPFALRQRDGQTRGQLGSMTAELLDTGLAGGGLMAQGLLGPVRTEQLARLLGGPALDSGWGLRSLGADEPGHNPFGHRSGAVRVQETATAVAGLAVAGYDDEARSLLWGILDAAEIFGRRLPEMFAAEQRTEGSAPLPHPAACRPSAVAAAAAVQLLTTLVGVRPDVPAGTVALRPVASVPLGALRLSGLRVAEAPFAVRVSGTGMGMIEEAADSLQLCG